MPGKLIVFAITFVIIISLVVGVIWTFVPVQMKNVMDAECRGTLLKMESDNGLTLSEKDKLRSRLVQKGFDVISINGTAPEIAKKGDMLNLIVEVDYKYRTFDGLFSTKGVTRRMVYDRTTIARRVVN